MAVVQPEILHPSKSVREVESGRDGIGREIGRGLERVEELVVKELEEKRKREGMDGDRDGDEKRVVVEAKETGVEEQRKEK